MQTRKTVSSDQFVLLRLNSVYWFEATSYKWLYQPPQNDSRQVSSMIAKCSKTNEKKVFFEYGLAEVAKAIYLSLKI